jgi:hypothetical protein
MNICLYVAFICTVYIFHVCEIRTFHIGEYEKNYCLPGRDVLCTKLHGVTYQDTAAVLV